jgi:hypothetical protein
MMPFGRFVACVTSPVVVMRALAWPWSNVWCVSAAVTSTLRRLTAVLL